MSELTELCLRGEERVVFDKQQDGYYCPSCGWERRAAKDMPEIRRKARRNKKIRSTMLLILAVWVGSYIVLIATGDVNLVVDYALKIFPNPVTAFIAGGIFVVVPTVTIVFLLRRFRKAI